MFNQQITDKYPRYITISLMILAFLAVMISTSSAVSSWSYVGNAYKSDGVAVLTQNQNGQTGAIWLQEYISDPVDVYFQYRAGGGSGADGMVFMFYKEIDNNLAGGGNLGFSRGSGYGIEFDSQVNEYDPQGKHVALIKNGASNHLAYSYFNGVNDNAWHDVFIDVGIDSIQVYIDGSRILTQNVEFSRSYGGFGFSAATGALNDWHMVRGVTITPYYVECDGCMGKGDSSGKLKKSDNPKPKKTGP
jgi:hypothetical protein